MISVQSLLQIFKTSFSNHFRHIWVLGTWPPSHNLDIFGHVRTWYVGDRGQSSILRIFQNLTNLKKCADNSRQGFWGWLRITYKSKRPLEGENRLIYGILIWNIYEIEINFMTNKSCHKDYVSPAYPSLVKIAGIEFSLKWMVAARDSRVKNTVPGWGNDPRELNRTTGSELDGVDWLLTGRSFFARVSIFKDSPLWSILADPFRPFPTESKRLDLNSWWDMPCAVVLF